MGFKIREIETECTFSSALTIDALRHAIPPEAITRILAQEAAGEVRERKLTMSVVVWLVIALHLDATRSISAVLGTLACGLRFIWSDPALSRSRPRRPVAPFGSACACWPWMARPRMCPMRRRTRPPLGATPARAARAPFRKCRRSIWPSVAHT